MYSIKNITSLMMLIFTSMVYSQPNTEVFLFDLIEDANGYSLSNPINVSNNAGYDNQPSFASNDQSIFYARTIDNQTDIAQYSIKNGKTTILSNTLEGSEYSPTPMPDGRISSIRLDTTGLQLLYAYDSKGRNEVLVENLVIGYHSWLNANTIVTFVLGDPATMQIVNTKTGDVEIVGQKIGRSLHKMPSSNHFSFVDKSKDAWTINKMNPKTKQMEVLTPTLTGSEDYAWTPKDQIIMGKESKLHLWRMDKGWKMIADLSKFNISKISRIAISSDGKKLALVSE
ncbi:MAG: TolB family protein [Ekhidna sp.]